MTKMLSFSLWCPTAALSAWSLLFSRAVPKNDPLLQLQLQLQSAGGPHVAFRNICESQISEGKPKDIFSIKWPDFTKIADLCDVLMCIVIFVFHHRSQSKLRSVTLKTQHTWTACLKPVRRRGRKTPVMATWSPGWARRVFSPRAYTDMLLGMLPTGTWSLCDTTEEIQEKNKHTKTI